MTCKELTPEILKNGFIDSFDYVLTDCDGVLWSGQSAIEGSLETIDLLRLKGKKIFFVTNNTLRSRDSYLVKCKNLNFTAAPEEFYSISLACALYLKKINFNKKVYLVAGPGLAEEFDKFGIKYLPIGPESMVQDWMSELKKIKLDPEVGAVVIGLDEHVNYTKLVKAASYLKDPNCLFIGSNYDECFPPIDGVDDNLCVPDTGPFLAAVESASGRKCTIIGKPSRHFFDAIKEQNPNIDPKRTIMIGDRLNTDVQFGNNIGVRTILVLTGVTKLEDVEQARKANKVELLPTYYVNSLKELSNV